MEDLLKAGHWIWFSVLAEDDYNYRSQEGYKQIKYDERVWTCQGPINEQGLKNIVTDWANKGMDCRFVLAHLTSPLNGYRYGKVMLFYIAPHKLLKLDYKL
jgi:hypothetical protein